MIEKFAGCHLRFQQGAWRNDDGDPVDVVEVVRCKECTFRLRGGYCKTVTGGRSAKSVDDTFFCGYGERRGDNG